MADFWDKQHTLGEFEITEKRVIVVSETEKDGKSYLDIRNYYRKKDGEFTPAKGISIPIEHVDHLVDILDLMNLER